MSSQRTERLEKMKRCFEKELWHRLQSLSAKWLADDPDWLLGQLAAAWAELKESRSSATATTKAMTKVRAALQAGANPAELDVQFPLGLFAEGAHEHALDAFEAMALGAAFAVTGKFQQGLEHNLRAAKLLPDLREPWDAVYRFASTTGDKSLMAKAKANIERIKAAGRPAEQ